MTRPSPLMEQPEKKQKLVTYYDDDEKVVYHDNEKVVYHDNDKVVYHDLHHDQGPAHHEKKQANQQDKRLASEEEEKLLAYVVLADKRLRWAWLVMTATFKFTFHILSRSDATTQDKKLANKVQKPTTDFARQLAELFGGKTTDMGFHMQMKRLEYQINLHERVSQEIDVEEERPRNYDIDFSRKTTDLEQTLLELLHQADVAVEEVFKVMCRAYQYSKEVKTKKGELKATFSDLHDNSGIFTMNHYLKGKATALEKLHQKLHTLYKDTKCHEFRQPSRDIQGVAIDWIVSFDQA